MADQKSSSGVDENSVDLNSDMTEYVKYLKLAVAVAIIRCRPVGLTGQQYAEQLCARYQLTQLNWEHEARRLKQQLNVVLQQKQVLDQLGEHPLTPPLSVEAACNATTSTARPGDVGSGGLLLSRHLSFLSGVLSLDSVAAAGQRAAAAPHVVSSTVKLVLDSVLRRLTCHSDDDSDVISQSAAMHAVNVVARVAADVTNTELCEVIQQFVRSVVANVMNNQLLNQCAKHQAAFDFLLSLSSNKSLQLTVISVLLDTVSDVADQLRQASDDDEALQVQTISQLENVGHVLDCVERVLTTGGRGGALAVEVRRCLSSQLDVSLRHVAHAFPLFAYRVWQLGGLVDDLQRSDVEDSATLH